MNKTNGTIVILFVACVLGLVLPTSSGATRVNHGIPSPQENSAKPNSMRIHVAENVPKASVQTPPVYPQAAIDQRIEGKVVLHIIIGGEGTVKESSVLSGPPLLAQAAVDAVKGWQYQTMSLNGSPLEMDTTVTLNYALGPPPTVLVNNRPLPAFSPEAITLRQQQHPPLPGVDLDTAADIRRLIEVTGMRNVVTAFFGSHIVGIRALLFKDLPASVDREKVANRFQEELQRRIASGQVLDVVIPIYAKHFTHEEIKSILAFYDTPAGKRYAQEAPSLMWNINDVAGPYWMNTVLPEIFKQMSAEYPELSNMKSLQ
jgi:TonB family protein